MTASDEPFLPVCATFLRQHVAPPLTRCLADETGADASRAPLVACVTTWLADLVAAQDAAVLAPERLSLVLETLWVLSILGLLPSPDHGRRFVDIALRPGLTRALELALAGVGALDLLRGTQVVDNFRQRQSFLVDMMADAADPQSRARRMM
ncbi:hypothetical protein [Rubrimonas cliftonensis]|uniref:Uncharacterized protein n=1 Tax=Rubrimonas cliftonensis TaxID=89524 RepID=A0A1H4GC41_9RHOB|nr:hypothetical protein [Rubrimonas cliftonensis]SEB06468.1 hypothetical protein SAMN05444370_1465 [Rubrimonas cliftonensis]